MSEFSHVTIDNSSLVENRVTLFVIRNEKGAKGEDTKGKNAFVP